MKLLRHHSSSNRRVLFVEVRIILATILGEEDKITRAIVKGQQTMRGVIALQRSLVSTKKKPTEVKRLIENFRKKNDKKFWPSEKRRRNEQERPSESASEQFCEQKRKLPKRSVKRNAD